jgi:hypothetical protein
MIATNPLSESNSRKVRIEPMPESGAGDAPVVARA